MKSIRTLSLLLLLIPAVGAAADRFYVNASDGRTKLKVDAGTQQAGESFSLGAGYWLNPHVGVQAEFIDGDGASSGTEHDRWRATGYGLLATASFTPASSLDLGAKAGVYKLNGELFLTGNEQIARIRAGLPIVDEYKWSAHPLFVGGHVGYRVRILPVTLRLEAGHFFASGAFKGGNTYAIGASIAF